MHVQQLLDDVLQLRAIPVLPGDQVVTVRQRQQTRLELPEIVALVFVAAETLPRDRQHGRQIVLQPVLHFTQQRGVKPFGRLAFGDVAGDFSRRRC